MLYSVVKYVACTSYPFPTKLDSTALEDIGGGVRSYCRHPVHLLQRHVFNFLQTVPDVLSRVVGVREGYCP